MTGLRHFVAAYPRASQAREFAANAERIIYGACNVIQLGPRVEFDAATVDDAGYSTYGDIALSVGAYGGPGTKLNGNAVPREQ